MSNSNEGSGTRNNNTRNANSVESDRRLRGIKAALHNAFELVGTEFTLSVAGINKTYRKKALTCHPDKGGDPESFKTLGNAVEKIAKTISTDLGIYPEADPDRAAGAG